MVKAAAGLVVLGTLCAGAALGIGIYKGITFAKQHTDDLDGAVKDAKDKAMDKFNEGITKATAALEQSANALKEWVAKQGDCNGGFGSGFGGFGSGFDDFGSGFDSDCDSGIDGGFDYEGSNDLWDDGSDYAAETAFDTSADESISDEDYEKLENGEDLNSSAWDDTSCDVNDEAQAHHEEPFTFGVGTTFGEGSSDFPDGECCDDCKNNCSCDGTSCTPEPEDDAELDINDDAEVAPVIPDEDAQINPSPFDKSGE